MADLEQKELSERELEILRLVATGVSNKEIAHQLFISSNTVKVHLRNIFSKIGATSRTEAALYAVRIGLVPSYAPGPIASDDDGNDRSQPSPGRLSIPAAQPARFRLGMVALFSIVMLALLGLGIRLGRQSPGPTDPSNSPEATSVARLQVQASMPTARQGLAVAAYEDHLYAIGGETDSGVSGRVEVYSPAEDSWAELASKPTAVSDVSAVVIGGKIYVPGGRTDSGAMTSRLEIYDPRENTWMQGEQLPRALSAYSLAAFEGKIFLIGGWDGKVVSRSVFEFDPGSDVWSERAAMPTGRAFAGAAVAGGKIFVIGGYDGEKALPVTEIYTPDRETGIGNPWETGQPMPAGRYAMGVASIVDIVHVIGGLGEEEGPLPALDYFPQLDQWMEVESPFIHAWSHLGLVPLGSSLHVLGGLLGGAPTQQNLSYQAIFTISLPLIR